LYYICKTFKQLRKMETYILKENVLTDNLLHLVNSGKVFKGGYIAIIEEYQFQNCWSDKLCTKRFRSNNQLQSYLNKNYPNFEY
jgi:hypothetical protein